MDHSQDIGDTATGRVNDNAMSTVDLESSDDYDAAHDQHHGDVTLESIDDNAMSTVAIGSGDDDNAAHDQLPSVEEYKANMACNGSQSRLVSGLSSPRRCTSSSDQGEIGVGDDEEQYVHDQLPHVDEIKGALSSRDDSWLALHYFAIFVGLVVLTVIIAVPTILSQRKNSTENGSAQNQQSPGQAPASPSPAPAPTEPPQQRMDEIIKYLVDLGISSETELTTSGTPQAKAVKWMAFEDEFRPAIPSTAQKYSSFVERYVLAVLYFSTNGPSWTYQMKFLTGVHHCQWKNNVISDGGAFLTYGVSDCSTESVSDPTTGGLFATGVSLPKNNLAGIVPSEFQYLHHLEYLSLPYNQGLSGGLGFGFTTMNSLHALDLHYCGFMGTIPDQIGSLRKLTLLALGNNHLEGALPESLFELTDLEFLGLDDNLFQGNIESFGKFTKLKHAYLEDNLFTGELTSALADSWATTLEELDLSGNNINSTIPVGIFNMTNLQVLDLHGNSLRGRLPDLVEPNDSLRLLALFENDLTGPIPETVTHLRSLLHLDLAKNHLSSPLPENIDLMTDLRYLYLGQNDFADHGMPTFLWSLTGLRELSMKNNSITGTIPSQIRALSSLQLLDLDGNRLVGTIPTEIGLLNGLGYLLLNRNSLSGTLPSTLTLLYDLKLLLIDHNKINGTADIICNDDVIAVNYFVADCEGPNVNIECKCCDLCCNDLNTTCNNLGWHVNLDPIWEYGYTRKSYQFSTDIVASEP